ncbi:MAG: hypothetical protein Q8O87_02380 [bacterium]|nr:hypothetical protein [bacterium]
MSTLEIIAIVLAVIAAVIFAASKLIAGTKGRKLERPKSSTDVVEGSEPSIAERVRRRFQPTPARQELVAAFGTKGGHVHRGRVVHGGSHRVTIQLDGRRGNRQVKVGRGRLLSLVSS